MYVCMYVYAQGKFCEVLSTCLLISFVLILFRAEFASLTLGGDLYAPFNLRKSHEGNRVT
jgi:hypothetical protein